MGIRTAIVIFTAILVLACSERQEVLDDKLVEQEKTVVEKTPSQEGVHEGRVLSVMPSGGYTYLEVESAGGRLWLASNQVNARQGQVVRWGEYAVMGDFYSKSLDRSFEQILFVGRVVPATPAVRASQTAVASEVIASGTYVYVAAEMEGRKIWLAAPAADIKAGDSISWSSGSMMRDFYSKTLDRSFEEILFVGAVAVNEGN